VTLVSIVLLVVSSLADVDESLWTARPWLIIVLASGALSRVGGRGGDLRGSATNPDVVGWVVTLAVFDEID
jgi:hypothetical protein